MTCPPPVEGEFYVCANFIFQLVSAERPLRYVCLRNWNGVWTDYPNGTIDAWPPTHEPWRIITDGDPLFDECCRQVALNAFTEGTTP